MGNVQANGRTAGESSRQMNREEKSVKLQIISTASNTDLHNAVLSVCESDEANVSPSYVDIVRLMSEATNLNMPTKKGYTAIGIAVKYRHRKAVKHMLKQDKEGCLYLDYYPGDRESTVREIIMETYPDLESLLPAPLMERLDSNERDIKLLAALQHNKYDIFSETLDSNNSNSWYDEPYHSSLLEIACQMKNRKKFVKLLLDKDADPNEKNRVTGMPLIHATARSGNFDVLKMLLKRRNIDLSVTDSKKRTILHWLARVSEKNPGDKERLDRCFKLVLNSCENNIIDWRDRHGTTALYVAVKSEFQDRVLLLLKRGADITFPIHGAPIISSVSTPMLEAILDDCLECNKVSGNSEDCLECNKVSGNSEDLKLTFNFETLTKILPHMAESPHQRELLKHPVTSCFIDIHYQYITFYVLLRILVNLVWLSTYICVELLFTVTPFALVCLLLFIACFTIIFDCTVYLFFRDILYLVIIEFLLLLPWHIHCIGLFFFDTTSSAVWFHLTVSAVVCSWLRLVLMIGRLPLVAVQLQMFKRVSVTFLKYMASFSILIIIVALVICIITKESKNLSSADVLSELVSSVLKTIVLFTGSLEFSTIPFDVPPSISYTIYLVLAFLMFTILVNLLNGLAVFDTQEIKRDAKTLCFVIRVRILMASNIQRIAHILFGPNEMEEGKLIVCKKRWNLPFFRLLGRPPDLQSLSRYIRTKMKQSKKPQAPEGKLTAMEKKFGIRLKEIQETLSKIVTRLDI